MHQSVPTRLLQLGLPSSNHARHAYSVAGRDDVLWTNPVSAAGCTEGGGRKPYVPVLLARAIGPRGRPPCNSHADVEAGLVGLAGRLQRNICNLL